MINEVRDHWYWRPGWRVGRSFYTWHITFQSDPVLAELHAAYQPVVNSLPGLTAVPVQWLHLTMQGIGFADKLSQEDLDPIVEAAQQRLAGIRPVEVRIGPGGGGVGGLQVQGGCRRCGGGSVACRGSSRSSRSCGCDGCVHS